MNQDWTPHALALVSAFGPGAAAWFLTRWWGKREKLELAAKAEEAKKIDELLLISRRLESDINDLTNRLGISEAIQNQLRGSLSKVEERVEGISGSYSKRLHDIEEKIARLDERTSKGRSR